MSWLTKGAGAVAGAVCIVAGCLWIAFTGSCVFALGAQGGTGGGVTLQAIAKVWPFLAILAIPGFCAIGAGIVVIWLGCRKWTPRP